MLEKNFELRNLKLIQHDLGKDFIQLFQTLCLQNKDGNVPMFDRDIGDAIKKACTEDSDAFHIAKAAQLIRRELFQISNTFNETFKKKCQESSVPFLLKVLVSMILKGPEVTDDRLPQNQAVLTISQVTCFQQQEKSTKNIIISPASWH